MDDGLRRQVPARQWNCKGIQGEMVCAEGPWRSGVRGSATRGQGTLLMLATRFSLSLCVGLALTLTASAAEVRGRIVHVDLKKNELQIEGRRPVRGQSLTLTLDPQTQVLLGSQAGTLNDLTAGRRARITYEERDGQRVAR